MLCLLATSAYLADAPFARADAPGTWDLVVSAPWLEGSKLKAIRELVDLLAKTIGINSKSVQEYSRVEAVPVNDPTIQLILRSVPVEDGERHIQSKVAGRRMKMFREANRELGRCSHRAIQLRIAVRLPP